MSDLKNNSEILFIYEAKLTNPNGDPDDENRPRMDPKTKRNLVSDVRLKRYFRDYVISKEGEDSVWVTKIEGRNVDATERLSKLGKPEDVLKKCIDARLFGATIPVKGQKGGGESPRPTPARSSLPGAIHSTAWTWWTPVPSLPSSR
ncbi:type I CRISPR-associated protein Cas7 [Sulfuracidifex tepidarius]|uniref:type I CRISPR-associated protein Cas7 n=1 Tax=Sulfuracidifex tepidarius TaxID=1294262 RepID=UPI0006CF572C|nr:type I CRISPR-associated protein Cas7 [Sulfuracidifex tepidarius]